MASRRSARRGITTAAVALVVPLWLGACGAGLESPMDSAPVGTAPGGQPAISESPILPAPKPQAAPPAGSTTDSAPPSGTVPATPGASPGSAEPPAGFGSGSGSRGAGQGEAAAPGTAPTSGDKPGSAPPRPAVPAPGTGAAAPGNTQGAKTVTAYFVLLDDGGSGGVRFGCNDSLVGVRVPAAGSAEPLPAAMRALLDGSAATHGAVYNALSASTLEFLAGSFDGTTVTVYLSGAIRPGGVCDIPRVEAQLTQTAVSSVGAIRTEIYVNGVALAEALGLK